MLLVINYKIQWNWDKIDAFVKPKECMTRSEFKQLPCYLGQVAYWVDFDLQQRGFQPASRQCEWMFIIITL